jgi:nucleoside-diphosphate-sugar epimerase
VHAPCIGALMTMEQPLQHSRITVTGAGGFLGPHAVEALARKGARVQAIIGPPNEAARIPPGAAYVAQADICDADAIRKLIGGADAVVHLAGPASVGASFQDPSRYLRVHGEGTAALLKACRAEGVRRLVYVSSAEIYGRPLRSPVREDHPLSARSPYAAAKIAAEKLIEAQVHAFDLRAVILRPFSVYGPGAAPESLIPTIIGMARRGLPVVLRDLRPVRDYCFVTDVAEAIANACSLESRELEIFNIGTMRGTSVERIAGLILEALAVTCPVREVGERDRPGRSEIHELIADNGRARDVLGWRPAVALDQGLRMTIAGCER